jgi:ABC-type multidrug transport system ATPase subunit
LIEVRNLTKSFESQTVLDAVSLDVRRGEAYALLGENGSGKTTLLKCVAGLFAPLEGSLTIDGLDRQRDHLAIRRFTAWLPDQPFLYVHFTARGWLKMVADIYGVEPSRRDGQVDNLLAIFDLVKLADKKIAWFSSGQYKKLAICGMLISNARLYVMDEPFTGEIDPPGLAAFKEILRGLRKRGDVTVLFSTQMVDQAEQLATRIGILADGRIAVEGTAAELKARFGAETMEEVFTRATRKDFARTRGFLDSFGS